MKEYTNTLAMYIGAIYLATKGPKPKTLTYKLLAQLEEAQSGNKTEIMKYITNKLNSAPFLKYTWEEMKELLRQTFINKTTIK